MHNEYDADGFIIGLELKLEQIKGLSVCRRVGMLHVEVGLWWKVEGCFMSSY